MTAAMIISGTVGWFVLAAGVSPRAGVLALSVRRAGHAGRLRLAGALRPRLLSRRQAGLCVLGGVALALNWTLLFGAYGHASISVATIVYHAALHAGRAGRVLRRNRARASSPGAGLRRPGGHRRGPAAAARGVFATGVALALGAAFFYAIAAIIAKGLTGVPPHLIVLIQLLIGAALMSPSAALPDQPRAWGLLVAIGVVHTGLMSTLLYSAADRDQPHRRAVLHLPHRRDAGGRAGVRSAHERHPDRRGGADPVERRGDEPAGAPTVRPKPALTGRLDI